MARHLHTVPSTHDTRGFRFSVSSSKRVPRDSKEEFLDDRTDGNYAEWDKWFYQGYCSVGTAAPVL